MTSNVVSFPREPARVWPGSSNWQSVGDLAGHVLGRVAYRCDVASEASEILRKEGGRWLAPSPIVAATAE